MFQTTGQYKKLEKINALNIVSLDSTGSIVDNRIKQFTCLAAFLHSSDT